MSRLRDGGKKLEVTSSSRHVSSVPPTGDVCADAMGDVSFVQHVKLRETCVRRGHQL